MFTKKQINNCRDLRDCVNKLLGNFFQSESFEFDVVSLNRLIEPLPPDTQEQLRLHVLNLVRVYRNVQLHGAKNSSTSLNRRLARMDAALYLVEGNFIQKFGQGVAA